MKGFRAMPDGEPNPAEVSIILGGVVIDVVVAIGAAWCLFLGMF